MGRRANQCGPVFTQQEHGNGRMMGNFLRYTCPAPSVSCRCSRDCTRQSHGYHRARIPARCARRKWPGNRLGQAGRQRVASHRLDRQDTVGCRQLQSLGRAVRHDSAWRYCRRRHRSRFYPRVAGGVVTGDSTRCCQACSQTAVFSSALPAVADGAFRPSM